MGDKRAILVIGAGDATGGAIARRVARKGYIACVTRRQADKLTPLVDAIWAAGGPAHGFGSDARIEAEMVALVAQTESDIAPIEVAVFNIGANVPFGIPETTARVHQEVGGMACFGGFLMGREAAKHALRALAQSMARALWPKGIHVAHPIADGAIDTEFIRSNFPQRDALKQQGGILSPESIAEASWQIHQQPRDAWTHKTELRPWLETW